MFVKKPNHLYIAGNLHKINFNIDDFKAMRQGGFLYVDKTKWIEDILTYDEGGALLFTRPRRFGKSLNLSMLRYFFDMTENAEDLFKGLYIESSEFFKTHLNQHPVLHLNFKGINKKSINNIEKDIVSIFENLINDLYEKYRFEELKSIFLKTEEGDIRALGVKEVTKVLAEKTGKKVIVLVDEYDSILNQTYGADFWQEITKVIKNIFGELFKSNEYLELGVLTGVSRIGKELGFSDMNNLSIFGMTKLRYYEYFGFTEAEVEELLKRNEIEMVPEFYRMYNGYKFGKSLFIFNTVSILKFLDDYYDTGEIHLSPYWINSSTNSILRDNIAKQDLNFKNKLLTMLEGKSIIESLFESIDYDMLEKPAYMFSLLVDTGYLCPVRKVAGDLYEIKIPNEEIKYGYRDIINLIVGTDGTVLNNLCFALIESKKEQFEMRLNDILIQVSSFNDFAEKENSYHNLLIGALLYLLGKYYIKSNRESGHGRYDIALIPAEEFKSMHIPIIIEFKTAYESHSENEYSDEALLELSKEAIMQIKRNNYYAEYNSQYEKEDFLLVGIGTQGKRCKVSFLRLE